MKRSTCFLFVALIAVAAQAAKIDMKDPRRAVGSDDDVRVDAQLTTDFVSPHAPLGVTIKVHNLSPHIVAVAEKRCEASYDNESATITLSVGSEVPTGGEMPRLVLIRSGEERTFTAGAMVNMRASTMHTQRIAPPAFVQIKVNVLRDADPFLALNAGITLSDEKFDQWIKSNDSIELNTIPVRYQPAQEARSTDASQH